MIRLGLGTDDVWQARTEGCGACTTRTRGAAATPVTYARLGLIQVAWTETRVSLLQVPADASRQCDRRACQTLALGTFHGRRDEMAGRAGSRIAASCRLTDGRGVEGSEGRSGFRLQIAAFAQTTDLFACRKSAPFDKTYASSGMCRGSSISNVSCAAPLPV
jgi:hypothetical protein